jgi:hypothetical protein
MKNSTSLPLLTEHLIPALGGISQESRYNISYFKPNIKSRVNHGNLQIFSSLQQKSSSHLEHLKLSPAYGNDQKSSFTPLKFATATKPIKIKPPTIIHFDEPKEKPHVVEDFLGKTLPERIAKAKEIRRLNWTIPVEDMVSEICRVWKREAEAELSEEDRGKLMGFLEKEKGRDIRYKPFFHIQKWLKDIFPSTPTPTTHTHQTTNQKHLHKKQMEKSKNQKLKRLETIKDRLTLDYNRKRLA